MAVGGTANQLLAAQLTPSIYLQLDDVTRLAQGQMTNAYLTVASSHTGVTAYVDVPAEIAGRTYTLTVTQNGITAASGSTKIFHFMPNLPNATWTGTFKSGVGRLVVTATYLSAAIQVQIGS